MTIFTIKDNQNAMRMHPEAHAILAYKTFYSLFLSFSFLLFFFFNEIQKFFFSGKKVAKKKELLILKIVSLYLKSVVVTLFVRFLFSPKKQKLGRSVHQLSSSSSHDLKTHISLSGFLSFNLNFGHLFYFIIIILSIVFLLLIIHKPSEWKHI